MATPLERVKPAERWGVVVGALVWILVRTGLPARLGLGAEDVAELISTALLLAPIIRAAWQSWRAGDLAGAAKRIESVVTDPRVAAVFQEAVGKAAATIAAAKVPPRPVAELHLRGDDRRTHRPLRPEDAPGGDTGGQVP